MNILKTICMALILLSCFAAAWRFGLMGRRASETKIVSNYVLQNVAKDDITYLEINSKRGNVKAQRIQKSDNKEDAPNADYLNNWEIVDPLGVPTDNIAIDKLLDALVGLSFNRAINIKKQNVHTKNHEDELDKENGANTEQNSNEQDEFGLNSPELVVTIKLKDLEHRITFGKKHPISNRRYTSVDDKQEIIMIEESKFSLINLSPFDLMDKVPTRFNVRDVREILVENTLESPMPRRKFVKEENNMWHLYTDGDNVAVDLSVMEDNLDKLSSIYAKGVLLVPDGGLSVYDLSPPRYTFTITLKNSKSSLEDSLENEQESTEQEHNNKQKLVTLLFGEVKQAQNASAKEISQNKNVTKKFYFKDALSEWIGVMSAPVHYGFVKDIGEYRPKNIFFGLDASDIGSVEVVALKNDTQTNKRKPIVINRTRKTTNWAVLDGSVCDKSYENDSDKVANWVQKLLNLRVASYPDGIKVSQSNDYLWRIVIKNEMQGALAVLDIGPVILKNDLSGADVDAPRLGRFVNADSKPFVFVVTSDVVDKLFEPMFCR